MRLRYGTRKSNGKANLPVLGLLCAAASAVGVWSELKADPASDVNMEHYQTVAGDLCIGDVDEQGNCVADESGYLLTGFIGATGDDLQATTWVDAEEGYGQPGSTTVDVGRRFAVSFAEWPDNKALAGASVTGQTTVHVEEFAYGETVEEYDSNLAYALLTRQVGAPTVVHTVTESWITGNLENFQKVEIWKNGGNDRPEAMDGTISMVLGGETLADEEPVVSGWVEKGHRLDNFPAQGDGVLTD